MKKTGYEATTGRVDCPCGQQILSNSGKVMHNYLTKKMACWGCKREFDPDFVYSFRVEGEVRSLPPFKRYYCYGPEDMSKCTEDHLEGLKCFLDEAEPGDVYVVTAVDMTEHEYEQLPEYTGP